MNHVLVTGGAGFIGSHVVDRLLADGRSVTVVDNYDPFYDRSTKLSNLARHISNPRFTLIEADIRDLDALLARLPAEVDAIVHLAASAGVRPSLQDPLRYVDNNIRGTQTLLELCRERGIKQLVFSSSSSVYGANPNVPWNEKDQDLRPISPYAATKLSGEMLGSTYSHLYDIRFIALRLFTVYGPRQRPDLAIHQFARSIAEGKPITLFGNGDTRRDYTFVEDVAAGIASAVEYTGSKHEVINIGNTRTVSLKEMVSTLEVALDRTAIVEYLPEQPGDVRQTWADISRARRLLGFEPTTDFRCGVQRFVEWLRVNRAFDSEIASNVAASR